MQKTKICHITTVHPPFDVRIFHKECKTLVNKGFDVTLIAQHDKDETVDGVKIVSLPFVKNRIYRMFILTIKVFWLALKQKADGYHFHDPELLPFGLMIKYFGKKVIYDVHEDVPMDILSKDWLPIRVRKIISKTFRIFENYASKKMTYIITATPFIRDRFLHLGCRSVDINNYPILDELYLHNVCRSKKEFAVCYIGGINKERGIFEMIDAISKLDIKLLIAGKFDSNKVHEEVKYKHGWEKVIELGYINREEISELLQRALAGLVVLHPIISFLDSHPIKMFEYMSAGIPVIASNFPLWKEIIEGNKCGICVNPLDPLEITKAIQWIVDHPDESKHMGENGRKAIEEKYNWENEAKKLLNICKEILR